MKLKNSPYFYAVLAILFWSTVSSAFKIGLKYLEPATLLLYSSLFSTLTLFTIVLLSGRINYLFKLKIKDYLHSAFLGFLNPFLYYLILFKAYDLLKAQEAQTLNYTWAIMLVILSVPLLKHKVKPIDLVSIVISFFGAFVIASKGNFEELEFTSTYGVILALSSSVVWALFWIMNIKDKLDASVKLLLSFGFGSVFVLLYCIITKQLDFNISGLFSGFYIGLFEMGITFVVWSKALKLSHSAAKISNLIYITPFLSLVFIYFILGEKINYSTIVGLILIIFGILLPKITKKTVQSN